MVSALSLSIAQRLVRKLCVYCKIEKEADEKEMDVIKLIIKGVEEEGKNLENTI